MYDDYSEFLIKRFQAIFGENISKVIDTYSTPSRKAIRINTLKIGVKECIERLSRRGFRLSKVPWCDYVLFVDKESSSLAATVEHLMGYFYIQDATSAIPGIELNPSQNDLVLDMAASPGGKTTHLSQIMKNCGAIVASEINSERMSSMINNIVRTGSNNVITMRTDALEINEVGLKFDKILLDAPCTADGTIAKNSELKTRLTQEDYNNYSDKQKQMIESAKKVLKPKGILLYSTCSTAPEENEMVVEYAVEKLGFKLLDLVSKNYWTAGMTTFFGEKHNDYLKRCGRVVPYQYHTQAFFVAKLQNE